MSTLLMVAAALLWRACAQGEKLLQTFFGHDGMVRVVAFSPDGTMVASGGSINTENNDWSAKVWDITDPDPTKWALKKELIPKKGRHYDQVMTLAFSPDSKRIAVADEKASHMYDISSKNVEEWVEIREMKAHKGWGRAIQFSKDGKKLFSCSDDATTVVWDLSSEDPTEWKKNRILKGHKGGTYTMALSPDERYIATGGSDWTVRIWDKTDPDFTTWKNKEIQVLKGHTRGLRCLSYSPDGKLLASSSDDGFLRIWSVVGEPADWKEVKAWGGHTAPSHTLTFSADSKYIITGGSDFVVKVWKQTDDKDPASWAEVAEVGKHDAALRGVASWGGVDGKRWLLGTTGDDMETRIFELDKETLGVKRKEL